jgi:hypothetical protein
MSRMKIAVVALAGAAFGVTLWQWLPEDQQPVIPRAEVVKEYVIAPPSAKAADTDMAVANPLGQPIAAPAKPAPAGNKVGRQLRETKDLKAFVLEALKQPEKGGAFYTWLALDQCSTEGVAQMKARGNDTIREVIAYESTISTRRMEAISARATLCAGFEPGEIEALHAEAVKLGTDGSDPLFAMVVKVWGTRRDTPEQAQALEVIYRSGNLALISHMQLLGGYLAQSRIDNNDGTFIYQYNGRAYPDQEDQRVIDAGAQLSVCADDDYCLIDSLVLTRCFLMGTCYASREEYVREFLLLGDSAAYDKAQQVSSEIRGAIARGDRSIFH